jgi:Ca2+/H+ antiporter, TMEM165/GDT1 family
MQWTHILPTVLASFMASLVEFVEALTIVLAVGTVRGWRPALMGSAASLIVLLTLVLVFGQSLAQIPLATVQLVVGTLLLLFGLRWLRKAILRSAGSIPLHDEAAAFAQETALLGNTRANVKGQWDKTAFMTAFKIVMLEGIEVVFIVIAIGAGGKLIVPAAIGAVAALFLVVLLGLWLHRPLATVPENALKFGVGIMLAAFGTFWVGEGAHLEWPGKDWAILVLIAAYFVLAQLLVIACRNGVRNLSEKANIKTPKSAAKVGVFNIILNELIGLFIDDSSLAIGIVLWALIAWAGFALISQSMLILSVMFFLGFAMLLSYSALRAVRT